MAAMQWDDVIPPENGKIHMNKNGAVLMSVDTYFEITLGHKEVVLPKEWIARWMNRDVREKLLDHYCIPEVLKEEIRKKLNEPE